MPSRKLGVRRFPMRPYTQEEDEAIRTGLGGSSVDIAEKTWRVLLHLSEREQSESDLGSGSVNIEILEDIKSLKSTLQTDVADGFLNTEMYLRENLEDTLQMFSECITSTVSSETTESTIFIFASLTLRIAKLIIRSPSFARPTGARRHLL